MSSVVTSSRHLVAFASLLIGLFAIASMPTPANAQTTDNPDAPTNPAADTPIAVPFIGSYEVWCTSFNPAPGDRCRRHHTTPAIDFGMEPGTPIYATGDGVVEEIETGCSGFGWCRNGAGNFVAIEHADGRFSRYLHLTDVLVKEGDLVSVGDLVGTSGVTGQNSSPHLHYDEQFPRHTRSPMGDWLGCVDGEVVRYPQVFGYDDWNLVPYGSIVRNDDFECLTGVPTPPPPVIEDDVDDGEVELEQTPPPSVVTGIEQLAVAPPHVPEATEFEVRVTSDGGAVKTYALKPGSIEPHPEPEVGATVDARAKVAGIWQAWSEGVDYDPTNLSSGPTCGGYHASGELIGTPAAEVIIGTEGDDIIDGRGGSDIICALGGDDQIHGGLGGDWIFGGPGDDIISGGKGWDYIAAGEGADTVRGGEGRDRIFGDAGDDHLHGTAGNDTVEGGAGQDTILGGIGHDVLRGGPGDDVLEGRNGRDYLGGGKGNDSLFGGNGRDRLVGAAGDDSFNGGSLSDRCATDAEDTTAIVECER